jgi:hypothetical protein
MKNKSQKILLFLSIASFLILCALFFFFYQKIENNIAVAKQLQVNLQTEIAKREQIEDFNNSFKSITPDETLFETHFAQSSNIVPFLNAIEQMADSVGTQSEVSSISVAGDNTGLIVDMNDTGSFSQVYKFITLLENSPYELQFDSVDMSITIPNTPDKKKGSAKGNVWQATIEMKLISFI